MLIICCGILRSGSTLQFNIVRSLVEMSSGQAHGMVRQDRAAQMHEQLLAWAKEDSFNVVKCHFIPSYISELMETGDVRFVSIYRDIRDTAASIKNKWGYKNWTLLEELETAMREFSKVQELRPVLMQRYEDVMKDTPGSVREISKFLGLKIDGETAEKIAQQNSIKEVQAVGRMLSASVSMRLRSILTKCIFTPMKKYFRICKAMRKVGFSERSIGRMQRSVLYRGFFHLANSIYPQDPVSLIHSDHISKHGGAAGAWRADLSESEIEEITKRYKDWLLKWGYALE